MERFYVVREQNAAEFLVETESFDGVRMIAETVAEDVFAVSGRTPEIKESLSRCKADRVVLMATVGKSPLLDRLERDGKVSLFNVRGKREGCFWLEQPWNMTLTALVI